MRWKTWSDARTLGGSSFSSRQSAREKPSGSTLRMWSPRERRETDVNETAELPSTAGKVPSRGRVFPSVVLSYDRRSFSFFLPGAFFSPREKCNRARGSEFLNFAETTRKSSRWASLPQLNILIYMLPHILHVLTTSFCGKIGGLVRDVVFLFSISLTRKL